MTIDFICEELAELFDSPCNYSPMDEKMFQDSYCESHCGQVTDKECWKQYFEKVWAERKTEPQTDTHDIRTETHECVKDTHDKVETMSCQECKWWFTDSLKHGGYCQSLLYNHECRYEPEVDCSWK